MTPAGGKSGARAGRVGPPPAHGPEAAPPPGVRARPLDLEDARGDDLGTDVSARRPVIGGPPGS